MRYIAAYLLAVSAGIEHPTKDDLKKIFKSVSVSYDDSRIESLLQSLKDKNIEELIAQGSGKLASVSSVSVHGGHAASSGAAASSAAPAAAKKEEPKEDEETEMGLSLFD